MENVDREFLRHIIATIAYRGAKSLRNAPIDFSDFRIGETTKTPLEILSHIGDLFDWALSQVKGEEMWRDSKALDWTQENQRFFEVIESFDAYIASGNPIHVPVKKLFQGPIADSLTHIGQIAMLRRLADSPIRGENYFKADIEAGRVGDEQSEPIYEFE